MLSWVFGFCLPDLVGFGFGWVVMLCLFLFVGADCVSYFVLRAYYLLIVFVDLLLLYVIIGGVVIC